MIVIKRERAEKDEVGNRAEREMIRKSEGKGER